MHCGKLQVQLFSHPKTKTQPALVPLPRSYAPIDIIILVLFSHLHFISHFAWLHKVQNHPQSKKKNWMTHQPNKSDVSVLPLWSSFSSYKCLNVNTITYQRFLLVCSIREWRISQMRLSGPVRSALIKRRSVWGSVKPRWWSTQAAVSGGRRRVDSRPLLLLFLFGSCADVVWCAHRC